jgi:phosphopantothenoylcysteine decarboxylase/phosphopantothenate--cysteine ligase
MVFGICGGIAAYKIPYVLRALMREGIEVRPVATPNALCFIGKETLRTLCGGYLYTDAPADTSTGLLYEGTLAHIHLADWADAMVIAPATANTIAKIAHGIGDNLCTSCALSFYHKPLVLVPAMNTRMWHNPATRDNIAQCRRRGIHVLDVDTGPLACGSGGEGRMPEPGAICDYLRTLRNRRAPLKDKRVLISAGATREPIDSVRVLTNRSSGRMGAALAETALALGAEVSVVAGDHRARFPDGITQIDAPTVDDMQRELQARFDTCDICIMAAAVGDYRLPGAAATKIDKRSHEHLQLTLERSPDILAGLGARKQGQILVGFALSENNTPAAIVAKMQEKHCDIMIGNTPQQSLETDTTAVTICDVHEGCTHCAAMTKQETAQHIFTHIARYAGYADE